MEMFYLVLYINATAITVIPEKYPNLAQCEQAAWGNNLKDRWQHSCIPAPKSDIPNCVTAIPGTNLTISKPCEKPYSGYYCGNNDCTVKDVQPLGTMPQCSVSPISGKLECEQ